MAEHSNYTLFVERVKDAKTRGRKLYWTNLVRECHLPNVRGFRKAEISALCDNRDTATIALQLKGIVESATREAESRRGTRIATPIKHEHIANTLFPDGEIISPESEGKSKSLPASVISRQALAHDLANIGRLVINLSIKLQSMNF